MLMFIPTLYLGKVYMSRYSIYVKNVASVLFKMKTLINIREFILGRKSVDVRNAGRLSISDNTALYIRGLTLG